ncbi:MAG: acyltransferase [Pseudomonadota bacterium]
MTNAPPRTLDDISQGRDNNLHLIRLLAASAVLVGHCWPLLYGAGVHDPFSNLLRPISPFARGVPGIAVYIFFFLSGFLVTKSMVERGDLIDYAVSRIARIYPALIVVVSLLVFVVGPIFTTLSVEAYAAHPQTSRYFLTNIIIWKVAFPLPGVFSDHAFTGVNGSLWTLPAEIRCYVLVALFWMAGAFTHRNIFNMLTIALAIGGYLFRDSLPFFIMRGHMEMAFFFLIGAVFYMNRDLVRLSPAAFVSVFLICLMLKGNALYHPFAALFLCMAIAFLGWSLPNIFPKLNQFGDISYGVYIYAYPVQQIVIEISGGNIGPLQLLAVATPIVFVLAYLSWRLIEKPALSTKSRLLLNRPRQASEQKVS